MEFIGLFFEFIFLFFGVYLYFFSIGKLKSKDPEKQEKAEAFRKANSTWIRIGALALIAIMAVNIYFHIIQILG